MKLLLIIVLFFSSSIFAEEECVFDSDEQKKFNKGYIASHKDSVDSNDGAIIISRANETIKFSRGGCVHFGISIESTLKGKKSLSEEELFSKVADYTREFGRELVDVKKFIEAIKAKKYSRQTGSGNLYYYVGIESVQAFEISVKSNNGDTYLDVGFYIN